MDKLTPELVEALTLAQDEIKHADQDGKNPYFKSDYATLEQVISTVKPVLNKHGVMFQQISHKSDVGACVETWFFGHGGMLSTGPVTIAATQIDPQAFGSAFTYAKRYSLSLACGIGHQKDDDAEQGMRRKLTSKPKDTATEKTEEWNDKAVKALADPVIFKYKVMKDDTIIAGCQDPIEYLQLCREHMRDPASDACKAMFRSSEDYIKEAQEVTAGKIKDAFTQLQGLYAHD